MSRKTYLTFLVLCSMLASAYGSPQSNQELMSTWINLESQRGHLKEDWLERKLNLEQKISLLDLEKQTLKEFLSDTQKESSSVDKERQDFLTQQTALEKEQQEMEQAVSNTLTQLQIIHPNLPPPLQEEWRSNLTLLASEKLNTSEKLESILSLLKKADEFNNQIILHKAPLITSQSADNEKINVVVNQIFLGLSHGWYVSDDGSHFGYGKPEQDGWQWWSEANLPDQIKNNTNAEQILDVVDILHEPTQARYLSLPIVLN